MKIAFIDIETAPTLGYFYGRRDINISPDQVVKNGFILCFQAAINDGEIFVKSLRKIKNPQPKADKALVEELAKLISGSDVVVAHNAERFDLARIAARMAVHKIPPFAPPLVVDTLKICRKLFLFESNSLDSVCQELGIGRKFHSGGFENSLACMGGDQKAWDKLLDYGKHDVHLLRELYYRLRPWMKNHPNHNLFTDDEFTVCHACGSRRIQWACYRVTLTMRYARYKCNDCGSWGQERRNNLTKEKRAFVTKGA